MSTELKLRRKLTLRTRDQQVVFILLNFPADSHSRFIKARGEVRIAFENVDWIRLR